MTQNDIITLDFTGGMNHSQDGGEKRADAGYRVTVIGGGWTDMIMLSN